MLDKVREIKVLIFLAKDRNPIEGMVGWWERFREGNSSYN